MGRKGRQRRPLDHRTRISSHHSPLSSLHHSGPAAPGRHKENNFAPAKDKQEMETMIRELQGEISQPGPWAGQGRGAEQG